ncbi:MAG: TIGR00296 family protein [Candidatus Pacearchaeota archaeon]|nr:MAG: TIGR00296 family protein [Candidatus Pacearchaeota archaeon]
MKMLSLDQGFKLISLARKAIESQFSGQELDFEEEKKEFSKNQGVFVTLNKFPSRELRGCIGFPYPIKSLALAVVEAAKSAAFSDTRFMPLEKGELDNIIIEISVLTVPEQIKAKGQDILEKIEIGKDGLIVQTHHFSGLLLPQVSLEQKWNVLEFLRATCIKAGLPTEIWLNPECRIYKFQAQIFFEKEPKGKVEEKS